MTDRVRIRIPAGREVDVEDFEDVTGQVAEEIRPVEDGWFEVRFPADVTPEQAAAVVRRAGAVSSVEEALLGKAAQALAANAAYLAKGAATTALEDKAQVRALTRQVNALVRLVTRALDSVDGT